MSAVTKYGDAWGNFPGRLFFIEVRDLPGGVERDVFTDSRQVEADMQRPIMSIMLCSMKIGWFGTNRVMALLADYG